MLVSGLPGDDELDASVGELHPLLGDAVLTQLPREQVPAANRDLRWRRGWILQVLSRIYLSSS